MIGPNIDVFLSCSFRAEDQELNNWFSAICRGLRLSCINVSAAYSTVPGEKAREYISASRGLIAIVTSRGQPAEMSPSVQAEIAFAYALKKRIILFWERGVQVDGFANNYATRLEFDRRDLARPEFLERVVASLHEFREDVAAELLATRYQFAPEYVALETRALLTLNVDGGAFVWLTSITKRLQFEARLEREITSAVWPNPRWKRPGASLKATWGLSIDSSSRRFVARTATEVSTADHLEVRVAFEPQPKPGDFIEYTRWLKTPYLNPLFADEVPVGMPPGVTIGSSPFSVYDGVTITERTQRLHYHCSFASEYGLRSDQVREFCAERTFVVDHVAPAEGKRLVATIDAFGGEVIADLHVENPQPALFYGFAWNLPERRSTS